MTDTHFAQVDQVGGTPTLEQFQRWLETKAHQAYHHEWPEILPGESSSDHWFRCNSVIHMCRKATWLLMQFKQEQRA